MSKRLKAKYKIDRRIGTSLWGRNKSPANKRPYLPGQHGPSKGRGRLSDYGEHLLAKQKLKRYYGSVMEKAFRNIYERASKKKGNSAENLVMLLESRLDTAVYRLKFAPTIFSARQMINHGHIRVNGARVKISSYTLSINDVVEVIPSMVESNLVIQAVDSQEREVPTYYSVDHKKMQGSLLRLPVLGDVPYPVEMFPNLVVEFYSR